MKEIDDEIIVIPANKQEKLTDYQINRQSTGFFYKTSQVKLDHWQLAENPKHNLRRSMSVQSLGSQRRQRRLQSIPDLSDLSLSDNYESKRRKSSSKKHKIYYELPPPPPPLQQQQNHPTVEYFTSSVYPSFDLPYHPSALWFYAQQTF